MKKTTFLQNKLQTARVLMIAAILLIVAFQSYWVSRLYKEEREGLKKEANNIFRDVVFNLQAEKFRADTPYYRTTVGPNIFVHSFMNDFRKEVAGEMRNQSAGTRQPDSAGGIAVVMNDKTDTLFPRGAGMSVNRVLPKELELALRKQIMPDGKSAMDDSAVMRKLSSRMGVNIIVRGGASADSLRNVFMQKMGAGKNLILKPPVPVDRRVWVTQRKDSGNRRFINGDLRVNLKQPGEAFVRFLTNGKILDDSIPVAKVDSVYRKELGKNNIRLSFTIHMGKDDSLHRKDTLAAGQFGTRPASVGFMKPLWYQAEFENPASFLARKVSPQILFSVFLVAFTSVAFIFLYRNLAQQRRLAEMKDDFISNITHELKTPIATVSVAVEALRNFGGIHNPERTKEYLDISAAELQRLGLLVDKVLKLSLFENRELEMKKEHFDLEELVREVRNTMRLQFEKHQAKLDMEIQGSYFTINADRLHITSVIYNLLDNAIKYSPGNPEIKLVLKRDTDTVVLSVSDKGMGIPAAFRDKVFDKFFRVPAGNHHNTRGYGLGLSYVAHVVEKHGGSISVTGEEGKGSTFTVKFPIA
ncbi:sensor histidine kinase [Sediminibacterium soli]|uniref:sensor histidine kinase n=1 Tax=Sediminibacterium soli TaxID=2698829 RepID=UPI00137A565B|nr:HAMP domain-containing sensor histidine kinase [Sediminibacterium soli]NCI47640.1 GHKL domain-containing protein [Sediminibacterium soli]